MPPSSVQGALTYLGYISTVSRLYLGCISAIAPTPGPCTGVGTARAWRRASRIDSEKACGLLVTLSYLTFKVHVISYKLIVTSAAERLRAESMRLLLLNSRQQYSVKPERKWPVRYESRVTSYKLKAGR